ncbi:MAG: FAD-dependent oxidoreductase [Candidatus Eisenbacteria bacterium]|nr:FAD-dependent oxidoreductase [Candidatus Eisenbacteria bacterium]
MTQPKASTGQQPQRAAPSSDAYDVAIIGGGVVGLATAYHLSRAGRRTLLLERAELGSGCSGGNAGLAGPRYSMPLAAPGVPRTALRWMLDPESPLYIRPRLEPALVPWFWRFWRASRRAQVQRAIPLLRDMHRLTLKLIDEMHTREPLPCDLTHNGQLMVYGGDRGLAGGAADARWLQAHGIPSRLLDPPSLRRMLPPAAPDLAGAVHYTSDVHLNPSGFLTALADRARAAGAQIREQCAVEWIERRGRRIRGLATACGMVRAGEYVLAAGAWSPQLARQLDLRIPLQPAKGYSMTIDAPRDFPHLGMLLAEAKVAVSRLGAHLRFAGTLELAGMDHAINDRRVAAIRRAVRRYLPGVPQPPPTVAVWHGLRPLSPDTLPYLGRPRRYENLVVATGHSMIGLSLGPATGMLVTQILQGEPPAIDLRLLRADRHG